MENQKPIDVLPNEHIAQHRKTQAVLWEEVAHVVQAARLRGFAYKLRTGRHDRVTMVYQNLDGGNNEVHVTWRNAAVMSSFAELDSICCRLVSRDGTVAVGQVYPSLDAQLTAHDYVIDRILCALKQPPTESWGVQRDTMYLDSAKENRTWNVCEHQLLPVHAKGVPDEISAYLSPLYTGFCSEPANRDVMAKLLKRAEDDVVCLMLKTGADGTRSLYTVVPGVSYVSLAQVYPLFEDGATYQLFPQLDHSSAYIAVAVREMPVDYQCKAPGLVGKPALVLHSVRRSYTTSVLALPPELHYLVEQHKSVAMHATFAHVQHGATLTYLVLGEDTHGIVAKTIRFMRGSIAAQRRHLVVVQLGSDQERALSFVSPNMCNTPHIFPVGDLNAITAGEWNEIADVLAQNAIPAIRLGTDWKETDLFCKGIKQ